MKRFSLLLCSVFMGSALVAGCTSTSAPAPSDTVYLTADPVEVTDQNRADYWVPKNTRFTMSPPPVKNSEPGYVVVRYLIDSNGNLFDPQVVESVPEGMWDYAGLTAISKLRFVPAETNTAKVPVYYSQKIDFQ